VLKDVLQRGKTRDLDLLEKVAAFAFDNVGSLLSSKKIADYLRSDRRSASVDTIASYLTALRDALLLFEVERYDLKGKSASHFSRSTTRAISACATPSWAIGRATGAA
jgi:hypothetical protein